MHKKNNPYGPYMQQGTQDAPGTGHSPAEDELSSFDPTATGRAGGLFAEPEAILEPLAEGAMSDDELNAMCLARICPVCPQKKEADDARLRALADLDNARKRLGREKEESIRFAAESVLADLVPSLDTLDLALQHAATDNACKSFVTGVDMTRKMLLDSLKKHGFEKIGAVGEPFDPARHEAVGMADVPEVPDGAVCALLSPGYVLRDRLLRPARVTVCRKS